MGYKRITAGQIKPGDIIINDTQHLYVVDTDFSKINDFIITIKHHFGDEYSEPATTGYNRFDTVKIKVV